MAGIVFGCIVPHPPLLVPAVGGGREGEVKKSTQAMEQLAEELAAHKPQTLLVISPHGSSHHNAMGMLTAPSSWGNFLSWGASGVDFSFANDLELVAAVMEEAKSLGVPLRSIGERGYELDWGVLVPMYFLRQGLGEVALVPLTFSWLPLSTHFTFGKALRRAAERVGKRVALVASGDLSHRLLPGAPAGYDPMGKVFDQKLVEAIAAYDPGAIMNLDEDLVSRAGECGLRSLVILLGALDGLAVKSRVLSYEGPFGVGYLVAAFDIEKMHPVARLARETVESYVREGKLSQPSQLTPEMTEQAGVFVSIKRRGELRGCIGTFEPTRPNVAEEIMTNALSSALRDPRFLPVTGEELEELEYSVDILSRPEPVESLGLLDPKRFGVIVECGRRRGLLLPDLEGVDSVAEQIAICRRKAGGCPLDWQGSVEEQVERCHRRLGLCPDEPVRLYRFEVRRYT